MKKRGCEVEPSSIWSTKSAEGSKVTFQAWCSSRQIKGKTSTCLQVTLHESC